MIELPVLIENIIEIVNVAIEMMLVFLYFSLLSKAKVNKAVLYLLILSIKLDTLTARILKLSSDSHSRIESAPLYSRRYPADR